MRRRWRGLAALGMICVGCVTGVVVGRLALARDLGRVRWGGDYDAARRDAARTGRPMMVLSRGGAMDPAARAFAGGPLSHPIVVDAAAAEFVAVAMAGDGSGATPLVRFLDAGGKDLAPVDDAAARDLTAARLLARMAGALRAAGRPVPPYLDLVAAEYNPPRKETATIAVTCYWNGESGLGRLDGVVATRTGMLGANEVIEVDFDPGAIEYPTVAARAAEMKCFRKAYAHSPEQQAAAAKVTDQVLSRPGRPTDTSNQQQFHLSLHPTYHFLPLTSLQATKVNAAIVAHEPLERFLSPGQIALQRRLAKIVEKDRWALISLEQSLTPDRSPGGLPGYAAEIERRVRALE